ncbi:MAG: hypothetical protein GF309_09140 [Candidatus Lokiarchaeota archaeon]|jgi:hypothetical protein|nr:hypothetical protein [Candidatus Lokiarchaeota archaeon]
MVKVEYLMVYTEAGLPIYSKCFGSFCKTSMKDPELLTGFLSALETIPSTISKDLTLDAVKMGPTDMRFTKTTPEGHSIVVGLSKDREDVAQRVFEVVQEALHEEQFASVDWTAVSGDVMNRFEKELVESRLPEAMHEYGGFSDQCPLGDQCPMHTNAGMSRTQRIWGAIKNKYRSLKKKMAGE